MLHFNVFRMELSFFILMTFYFEIRIKNKQFKSVSREIFSFVYHFRMTFTKCQHFLQNRIAFPDQL